MWDAAFDTVQFFEAVAWFRDRVPITDTQFASDVAEARRRAFWIAGVTHADIIKQVHKSLAKAIEDGVPFEAWKASVGETLRNTWGDFLTANQQPARLETILRNWSQHSYTQARLEQMDEPAVRRLRPFRMFDAVRDNATSEICKACDGTVLPADHEWWRDHQPPLHHRCRSGIRSLTEERARRMGLTGTPTRTEPQEGFGAGDEWDGPDRRTYPRYAKPPRQP